MNIGNKDNLRSGEFAKIALSLCICSQYIYIYLETKPNSERHSALLRLEQSVETVGKVTWDGG